MEQEVRIFFLSGPVKMASGIKDSPPPRDNFSERLRDLSIKIPVMRNLYKQTQKE